MNQGLFNAYALIIGIGKYHHLRQLNKTTTDAQDLRDLLVERGYPKGNIKLLLDDQATRPFISDQLDWLARYAQAEATVLIFFAGHGAQRVGGLEVGEYLCPVEADWFDLERTAISHERFTNAMKAIHAERLVVLMDACHAGGVGDIRGALNVVGGLTQKVYEQITTDEGRVVIASCKIDEVSYELPGWRNGLFTHYLLEGLRGKVADEDGGVRALRLFSYLSRQVPQHKNQHPLLKMAEAAADIVLCQRPADVVGSPVTPPVENTQPELEILTTDELLKPRPTNIVKPLISDEPITRPKPQTNLWWMIGGIVTIIIAFIFIIAFWAFGPTTGDDNEPLSTTVPTEALEVVVFTTPSPTSTPTTKPPIATTIPPPLPPDAPLPLATTSIPASTPTETATFTPAPPTNTNPSVSPIDTPIPASINTATFTPTQIPTDSPTHTPIPTNTATHTPTATETFTPTPIPIPTPTPTFCDAVSQIPRAECKALVALYNSTEGSNWVNTSGWLVTNTPCSWSNVKCEGGHVIKLVFDDNKLGGPLPPELGNLVNLETLSIQGDKSTSASTNQNKNELSGSIPPELCKLTNLEYLDLQSNQLTGAIPPCLGNLKNLKILKLNQNNLTGEIPKELGQLINLEELHLHHNNLTGNIPNELGKLKKLKILYLYNNQLSGNIPETIEKLTVLETLYLHNNKLQGAIPVQIRNLNLQTFYFDLSSLCLPSDLKDWFNSIPQKEANPQVC